MHLQILTYCFLVSRKFLPVPTIYKYFLRTAAVHKAVVGRTCKTQYKYKLIATVTRDTLLYDRMLLGH